MNDEIARHRFERARTPEETLSLIASLTPMQVMRPAEKRGALGKYVSLPNSKSWSTRLDEIKAEYTARRERLTWSWRDLQRVAMLGSRLIRG